MHSKCNVYVCSMMIQNNLHNRNFLFEKVDLLILCKEPKLFLSVRKNYSRLDEAMLKGTLKRMHVKIQEKHLLNQWKGLLNNMLVIFYTGNILKQSICIT